jgi:hypothetical protein
MSRRRIGLVAAFLVVLAPVVVVTLPAAAPTGADVHGIRLAWRPPAIVDPITLPITSARNLELDRTRDYILELPRDRPLVAGYGCLHIQGGHNIVLIGGGCYVPKRLHPTEGNGRAFYIEGNTGTVHLEGFHASGPGLTEGIDIFDSPKTVLQVENCRFETVRNWGKRVIHSDLIQADSLAALRVDRFTGSSQVQGIFRDGAKPAPAGADLRHVNITGVRGGTEGRLLWNGSGPFGPYPMKLSHVFVWPFPGASLGGSVWPPTSPVSSNRGGRRAATSSRQVLPAAPMSPPGTRTRSGDRPSRLAAPDSRRQFVREERRGSRRRQRRRSLPRRF